jgi:chromodomain-helicase-DNA-binding protein 4
MKMTGVEKCPLCGVAHFSFSRICPHFKSETQVRRMLDALTLSPEPREYVEAARNYLRGVVGNIVRAKKQDKVLREKEQVRMTFDYLKNQPCTKTT